MGNNKAIRGVRVSSNEFALRMAAEREQIGDCLRRLLASPPNEASRSRQENYKTKVRLREAIQHATLGPGKRIRPLLALRVARLLNANTDFVFRAAVAVELIHCASLVIDDLPCMDNAKLRRGRPAVHVGFGEATAILAAFSMIALAAEAVIPRGDTDAAQLMRLLQFQRRLLETLGCDSLTGGQAWDLELSEGQRRRHAESLANQKTAPLFELAARAGCVSSEQSPECHAQVLDFALEFGVLYQLIDDWQDGNKHSKKLLQNQVVRVRERFDELGASAGELAHFLNHALAQVDVTVHVFCA